MRYTNDTHLDECALMRVEIMLRPADGEPAKPTPIQAIAVVNDWSATPLNGESDAKRFVITHIPSGLRAGPDMTMRDAQRTAVKLGRESILQGIEQHNFTYNRNLWVPLMRAFPRHTRPWWVEKAQHYRPQRRDEVLAAIEQAFTVRS